MQISLKNRLVAVVAIVVTLVAAVLVVRAVEAAPRTAESLAMGPGGCCV